MTQKFDKNVPVPHRTSRLAFAAMEVGDSFVGDKNACAAAGQHKKRHPGWNYTTRKEGDSYRIWRTA